MLPFETPRGALISVHAAIGDLARLRFLVDTGTYRTVIDHRITRRLRLTGEADSMSVFGQTVPAERIDLPDVRVGPIRATGPSVLAADLSGLSARLGWRPDGILGLDLLRGHCLTVDYRTRQLIFACTTDWSTNVACDPRAPYLVVTARIDGNDYRLLVDTGSDVLALVERTTANHGDSEGTRRLRLTQ